MTDELLVQLFYAAQGNITQFRIKARKLLASSDAQADGGKSDAVAWQDAFNERHEFDVYPDHFMTGLRNEFAAGWYAALKSTAPQSECAPREALPILRRIAHELRTYNPAADEYKGEHIHKVWAREIDGAIEQAERAK